MSNLIYVTGLHKPTVTSIANWFSQNTTAHIELGHSKILPNTSLDIDLKLIHNRILNINGIDYRMTKNNFLYIHEDQKVAITQLLNEKIRTHNLFVFADPQLSLFLPLYQELTPKAQFCFPVLSYHECVRSLLLQDFYSVMRGIIKEANIDENLEQYIFDLIAKELGDKYLRVWINYHERILSHIDNSSFPQNNKVILVNKSLDSIQAQLSNWLSISIQKEYTNDELKQTSHLENQEEEIETNNLRFDSILIQQARSLYEQLKVYADNHSSRAITNILSSIENTNTAEVLEWKDFGHISNFHIIKSLSTKTIIRLDRHKIPNDKEEVRLFAIARNESLRLPYFLSYYQKYGVDRLFILDNNSTDNSLELLNQGQTNIHIFHTKDSYRNHWHWVQYLLNTYGQDYWCVLVDIDELFHYPLMNICNIKQLSEYLELQNYGAIRCLLLDIYANKSLRKINYQPGDNPLSCCPYMDNDYYEKTLEFYNTKKQVHYSFPSFGGGMRERVFNLKNNNVLSKVPLFKYKRDTYITLGMHGLDGNRFTPMLGIVFHTKYLQDFFDRAIIEAARAEHSSFGIQYRMYLQRLITETDLNFHDPVHSFKYISGNGKIELSFTEVEKEYQDYVNQILTTSSS